MDCGGGSTLSQSAAAHHQPLPSRRRSRYHEPIVASKLGEVLGQQVIVENRPGAAGNVGAAIAAKATPDGYTLFACGAASHGVSPAIYSKLPFDPRRISCRSP
jgi:hypothetical protein